jgi:hypothetical protein
MLQKSFVSFYVLPCLMLVASSNALSSSRSARASLDDIAQEKIAMMQDDMAFFNDQNQKNRGSEREQRLETAERELIDAMQAEMDAESAANKTWGLRTGPTQENVVKAAQRVQEASKAYEELLNEELPENLGSLLNLASAVIVAAEKAEKSIAIAQEKRETYQRSWNWRADEKPILQAELRARNDAQNVKELYKKFETALSAVKTQTSITGIEPGSWQDFKIRLAEAAGIAIRNKIEKLEQKSALYDKKNIEAAEKIANGARI